MSDMDKIDQTILDLKDSLILTHNLDDHTVSDIIEQAKAIFEEGYEKGYNKGYDAGYYFGGKDKKKDLVYKKIGLTNK